MKQWRNGEENFEGSTFKGDAICLRDIRLECKCVCVRKKVSFRIEC